jgi:hypothetical protein
MSQTNWALLSDEELFNPERVVYVGEVNEFKKEKEKRTSEKRMEQERVEREHNERLNAIKNEMRYTDQLGRDDHTPTMRRCQQWLKDGLEFQTLFNMSIQDRLFVFEEQVVEIADDMRHDFKTVIKNGREKRVADPDMVARAKLRIEVRFRHLKAGRPQRWGDVSTLITKSDDPMDCANLSTEELEKRLADLDRKDRFKAA